MCLSIPSLYFTLLYISPKYIPKLHFKNCTCNPAATLPLLPPPLCPHNTPLPPQLRPHIQVEAQLIRRQRILLPRIEVNHVLNLRPAAIYRPIVAIKRRLITQQRHDPCLRRHLLHISGETRKARPAATIVALVSEGPMGCKVEEAYVSEPPRNASHSLISFHARSFTAL